MLLEPTWNVREKRFLNPRRGKRRRSGVWPPSKPNLAVPRAFCPLCPRPAVLPLPEPIPRPLRVFCFRAPGLSRRSLSRSRDPTVRRADLGLGAGAAAVAAAWVA